MVFFDPKGIDLGIRKPYGHIRFESDDRVFHFISQSPSLHYSFSLSLFDFMAKIQDFWLLGSFRHEDHFLKFFRNMHAFIFVP